MNENAGGIIAEGPRLSRPLHAARALREAQRPRGRGARPGLGRDDGERRRVVGRGLRAYEGARSFVTAIRRTCRNSPYK